MIEYFKKNYIYLIFLSLIFIAAVSIRFFTYIDARPLWHDETPVALTVMQDNFLSILTHPIENQKAPFFFWFLTKLSGCIGNYNEISLRFFPFIFSILSIGVFYIFSKELLKDKFAILFANLLFAINYRLIYFSQELKQYSGDILLFMTAILIYTKLLKPEFNIKKACIFLCFSTFLMLSSFPACFVTIGFILYKFFISDKKEKIYLIVSSSLWLIFSALYYKFFLSGLYQTEVSVFSEYWGRGFINPHNISDVFLNFYRYFLYPLNQATLVTVIFISLTITGFICLIKMNKNLSVIIGLSFLVTFLASVLKIYPIYGRTAIYLAPLLILLLIKSLDNKYGNKILIFILIIFIIFTTRHGFLLNMSAAFTDWDGRETLKVIQKNYNNNEIILVNDLSLTQFDYYKKQLNFNPENVIVYDLKNKSKEETFEYLNALAPDKKYWFYNIFSGREYNNFEYIEDWIYSGSNDIYEWFTIKKSSVIMVKKEK